MPYMTNGKRDYKKEYEKYHSRPEKRKLHAERLRARREAEKDGRVHKGDGKDLHHVNPLVKGGSNKKSNTRVVSRSSNRSVAKTSNNRMKGKG